MTRIESQIPTLEDGQVRSLGQELNHTVQSHYNKFVGKIKEKLRTNLNYQTYAKEFEPVISKIQILHRKITRQTIQIGIAGQTQVGKSTTYNRLMKTNATSYNRKENEICSIDAYAMEGGGNACSSCIAIYYPIKDRKISYIYPMNNDQINHKKTLSKEALEDYCRPKQIEFNLENPEILTSESGWNQKPEAINLRFLLETKNKDNPQTERFEEFDNAKRLCNHSSPDSVWIHRVEHYCVDDPDWCKDFNAVALVDLPGYGASTVDNWMFQTYEKELDGLILTFRPDTLTANAIREVDHRYRVHLLETAGIKNTQRRILHFARFAPHFIVQKALEPGEFNIIHQIDNIRQSFELPHEAVFFTNTYAFSPDDFKFNRNQFDALLNDQTNNNSNYATHYKSKLDDLYQGKGGIDSLREYLKKTWVPQIQKELAEEFNFKFEKISLEFEEVCKNVDRASSLSEGDRENLNNASSLLAQLGEDFSGQFKELRENLAELLKVNKAYFMSDIFKQSGQAVVVHDWSQYKSNILGLAKSMYSTNVWAFLIEGFQEKTLYTNDNRNGTSISGNISSLLSLLMDQVEDKLIDIPIPDLKGNTQEKTNLKELWARINPEYYDANGKIKPNIAKFQSNKGFLKEKGDSLALAEDILGQDFCQLFLENIFIGKFINRIEELLQDVRNDSAKKMDPSYRSEIFNLVIQTGLKLPLKAAEVLQDLILKRINILKVQCQVPDRI